MSEDSKGFVPLAALRKGAPEPERVLAEIRTIYFKTTRRTIQDDLAHAIALLRSLPSEDDREKAAVYMDGLSQLRSEWMGKGPRRDQRRG